jgi:hypothetical protein
MQERSLAKTQSSIYLKNYFNGVFKVLFEENILEK